MSKRILAHIKAWLACTVMVVACPFLAMILAGDPHYWSPTNNALNQRIARLLMRPLGLIQLLHQALRDQWFWPTKLVVPEVLQLILFPALCGLLLYLPGLTILLVVKACI